MADLPIPPKGKTLSDHAADLRSTADALDQHYRNQMKSEMDSMNEGRLKGPSSSTAASDLGVK